MKNEGGNHTRHCTPCDREVDRRAFHRHLAGKAHKAALRNQHVTPIDKKPVQSVVALPPAIEKIVREEARNRLDVIFGGRAA
jgi:hypothetical protein